MGDGSDGGMEVGNVEAASEGVNRVLWEMVTNRSPISDAGGCLLCL